MSKKKKNKKPIGKKKKAGKKAGFFKNWLENQDRRIPMIKFVLGLVITMALFFAISFTEFFENAINLPIVIGYAKIGSAILNLFGLETITNGTNVIGTPFTMNIAKGCDAIAPTVLFMAAVLVYPTNFSNKWKALIIAPFAFALLNLVRVVSLYLLGAFAPSFFDFAHYEFWQGAFILITILAWFYWLLSILNQNRLNKIDEAL